jgi:hypothetical protein
MKRKFEFETNLPLKVAKQHAYLELAKMREYKYELKNSLNIQPGESAEHVIAKTDLQYISNPMDFEAEVRYWCDPKVQVTMYLYYHPNICYAY